MIITPSYRAQKVWVGGGAGFSSNQTNLQGSPIGPLVQPQTRPEIDWGHPLALGLQCCFLPGVTGGFNIGPLPMQCSFDSAFNYSLQYTAGTGLNSSVNSSGMGALAPTQLKSLPITCYWRGISQGIGSTNNNSNLVGVTYDNAGSSPFLVWGLLLPTNGPSPFLDWNDAGTGAAFSPGFGLPANLPGSSGAVFQNSTQNSLYINGAAIGRGTVNVGPPNSTATSTFDIGRFTSDSTRHPNVITHLVYVWSRQFSDMEMGQLENDPYGLLIFPLGTPSWSLPFISKAYSYAHRNQATLGNAT